MLVKGATGSVNTDIFSSVMAIMYDMRNLQFSLVGPFYLYGLVLTPAWINNHINDKVLG